MAGPLVAPVGAANVSAPSDSPNVVAGNAAANAGGTTTLDVGYNVESENVDPDDLVIEVFDPATGTLVGNTDSLTTLSGTESVATSVASIAGDYRVMVQAKEEGEAPIATGTGSISVDSDVSVTGFSAPAAANVGQPIDVDVNVENSAGNSENIRIQSYVGSSATAANSETYSAVTGQSSTTIETTFGSNLLPGPHELSVNDRTPQTVMVSDPTVEYSGLTATDQDGAVEASATVTNTAGSEQTVNVPLYVDGEQNSIKPITLGAGNSAEVSLSADVSDGDHSVGIGDTTPQSVTVQSSADVIKAVSVDHANGTEPSEDPSLSVSDPSGNVLMDAELRTQADEYDLANIGADSSTQFEIVVEVHEDHEPMMLLGTAQDVTWTKEKISESDYYEVTIFASPLEAQYADPFPEEWGTDEESYITASFAYDQMLDVSFVTSDMLGTANLDGGHIATDAQSVGDPIYDQESESLDLYVAGPHYAADGTVNQGEYEAFLPDALLNEWGVDDPEAELTANYQDEQYDSDTDGYTVTDEGVTGGVLVEFPIHYSDGTVSISSDDGEDDSSGSDDGEDDSSGSTNPSSGWSPSTTETTTTTTEETTTIEDTTTTTTAPSTTTTTTEATTTEVNTTTETTETKTETETTTTEEESSEGSTPGFGIGAVLVSLVAATLLAIRRSD